MSLAVVCSTLELQLQVLQPIVTARATDGTANVATLTATAVPPNMSAIDGGFQFSYFPFLFYLKKNDERFKKIGEHV